MGSIFKKSACKNLLAVVALALVSQGCGKITVDLKKPLADAQEGIGAEAQEKRNADQVSGASQSEMDALETIVRPADFAAFDAAAVKNVSQAMLLNELSDEYPLYANKPASNKTEDTSKGAKDEVTKCIDKVLESGRVFATKNRFAYAVDFSGPCEGFSEVSWKMVSGIQCEGVDFSQFNGKKLENVSEEVESLDEEFQKKCQKPATLKKFSQQKVKLVYQTKAKKTDPSNPLNNQNSSIVFNILDASMNSDGKPCEVLQSDKVEEYKAECVHQSLSTIETFVGKLPISKKVERTIYKSSNIKEEKENDPIWFAQGSFDVVFNNWTGTISYSGGEAPRANMKSSTGEVVDAQVPVHKPMALQSFGLTGAPSIQTHLKAAYARAMALGE